MSERPTSFTTLVSHRRRNDAFSERRCLSKWVCYVEITTRYGASRGLSDTAELIRLFYNFIAVLAIFVQFVLAYIGFGSYVVSVSTRSNVSVSSRSRLFASRAKTLFCPHFASHINKMSQISSHYYGSVSTNRDPNRSVYYL